MSPAMQDIAAVLLAAGRSSRMGGVNKLLRPFRGRPILLHGITALQAAGVRDIVVVLPAGETALQAVLPETVRQVVNPEPERGMAHSIALGVHALAPAVPAAAILPADMPLVTAGHVRALLQAFSAAQAPAIAAPRCRGQQGHPVIFARDYFGDLVRLRGDRGAKALLREQAAHIAWVDFDDEAVRFDVDTEEGYVRLLEQFSAV